MWTREQIYQPQAASIYWSSVIRFLNRACVNYKIRSHTQSNQKQVDWSFCIIPKHLIQYTQQSKWENHKPLTQTSLSVIQDKYHSALCWFSLKAAWQCDKLTMTEAIIFCLWAVTNDSTLNGKQLRHNYIPTTMQDFSVLSISQSDLLIIWSNSKTTNYKLFSMHI